MPEEICRVGDLDLCFETFGAREDPALLLVMGLGTQMLGWDEGFCEALAARGFHVIRFDNRDVGRSGRMSDRRPPTLAQLLRRDRRAAAYTLEDMASDAVGLLDHLGLDRAHVVGASMGGMIAQTIALSHPERVRSLVSIMSNTGARWSGQPSPRVYRVLLGAAPRERSAFIEHAVRTFTAIGSPGFPPDPEQLRDLAARSFDRGHDPAGSGRQLAAIVAAPDRTARLRELRVPTLVIHGTRDRLIAPSGGRATARAIPGARLLMIDGMGHDLPRDAWQRIVDGIAGNAARADDAAQAVA
jgi:pimeloyl-ACP methyl ester carboxylesterase